MDWRLVCPLSRLSTGGGFTALLEGERVLVRRSADGSVCAVSDRAGTPRAHEVRIQHGMVEVSLSGLVTS